MRQHEAACSSMRQPRRGCGGSQRSAGQAPRKPLARPPPRAELLKNRLQNGHRTRPRVPIFRADQRHFLPFPAISSHFQAFLAMSCPFPARSRRFPGSLAWSCPFPANYRSAHLRILHKNRKTAQSCPFPLSAGPFLPFSRAFSSTFSRSLVVRLHHERFFEHKSPHIDRRRTCRHPRLCYLV